MDSTKTSMLKVLSTIQRICQSKATTLDCKLLAINVLSFPGFEAGVNEEVLKILDNPDKDNWHKLYDLFKKEVAFYSRRRKSKLD